MLSLVFFNMKLPTDSKLLPASSGALRGRGRGLGGWVGVGVCV